MATDKTEIARSIVTSLIESIPLFVGSLEAIQGLQEWRDDADDGDSIDFNDYESGNGTNEELIGENATDIRLKHLDGALVNKILGAVLGDDGSTTDSIVYHMQNTTVSTGPLSGKTYWELLQMVRS